uniref:Uncharacterized protein n=1 Tax=Arundo donax TaxID=35708 RepID=A0A0A8YK34_ARUDO
MSPPTCSGRELPRCEAR